MESLKEELMGKQTIGLKKDSPLAPWREVGSVLTTKTALHQRRD